MANPEHLKILKQGVEVWNRWREENPGIHPDLSFINLAKINLRKANLVDVSFVSSNLDGANLRNAKLQFAHLLDTKLRFANFTEADLGVALLCDADLSNADLSNADLNNTNFLNATLRRANFKKASLGESYLSAARLDGANLTETFLFGAIFQTSDLKETDFTKCEFGSTIFADTNLSICKGLDTVQVSSPCSIDFQTLRASRNLPKSFLLKIGLPENYINYLPDFFDENPIRMYPVFLYHSWQNKDFAGKLYEALIARGVQVWYDEKKMKPGDDIFESLSRGIEVYDKMILVCSQQSLKESWWVDREIDRILAKERLLQKERGKRINLLIPIRIDDHIFEWDGAKGEEVRRYIIGDFRHWQDEAKFQKALDELIAALNVDRGEDAPPSFL